MSYSAARLSSRGWSRPGSACNALAAIESSGLPKDRVEKYPPAIVLAARLRYQPNAASALVGEVMRPNPGHPYHLAITFEEDRHRDEERRHERHRAMLESRAESPSLWARLEAAALILVRSDHSLTPYRCRLPDGSIGRVAVVPQDGKYALVCRLA